MVGSANWWGNQRRTSAPLFLIRGSQNLRKHDEEMTSMVGVRPVGQFGRMRCQQNATNSSFSDTVPLASTRAWRVSKLFGS